MPKRGAALELAVLGLLHETPMHGYELRKRVNSLLGWGRVLSYGTLYPCLKQLTRRGLIVQEAPIAEPSVDPVTPRSRRGRIVYRLTAEGKETFTDMMAESGPSAWEDDNFGVHFAFFARTDAETRVRILEGRRSRLEERMEGVRTSLARTRERVDTYTLELQRHGLESVEREVRWLSELIDVERAGGQPGDAAASTNAVGSTGRPGGRRRARAVAAPTLATSPQDKSQVHPEVQTSTK
ncbi:MAG: helix-turn-helix transcriptional regulator [Nocardioidaceae bacterium]